MSDDVIEAMKAAIREAMGPGIVHPEAGAAAIARIKERQERAADTFARAALRAAEEAGWRLVPMELTAAMDEAGWDVLPFAPGTETHRMAGGISPDRMWSALLAAAPKAGGGSDASD